MDNRHKMCLKIIVGFGYALYTPYAELCGAAFVLLEYRLLLFVEVRWSKDKTNR